MRKMKTIQMKSDTTTSVSSMTLLTLAVLSAISLLALPVLAVKPAPVFLDPKTIPKFVNPLVKPPEYQPTVVDNTHEYTIHMRRQRQAILPTGTALTKLNPTDPNPDGLTEVWGYYQDVGGSTIGGSPGGTFEAVRDIPISVTWVNEISVDHMFAVDPTLHWANPNMIPMPGMPNAPTAPFPLFPPGFDGTVENPPTFFHNAQSPVPLIPHLHGGEVQSYYDGHPEAWFTSTPSPVTSMWHGDAYIESVVGTGNVGEARFYYPNTQPPTTLWYHDHALGITRINVMSGLAGFYLLRDPLDTIAQYLPSGQYEMPLVIQDRTFKINGEFWFPDVGLNPTIHPYWMPEFFGNTIMVNGLVWPNMNVDRGQYRFQILDGSNARFYTLSFSNKMPFTQIGSDGGYLQAPAPLTELTIAPGERVDILVDFSNLAPGTKVILENTAKAPFPRGAPADPQTVGQIMQFTVTANAGPTPATLPAPLNPTLTGVFPTLPLPTKTRTLVLWEVMGAAGPLEILLNGQKWDADISETPKLGSTEDWVIVNPTADTHPIHLHLVQFQLVSRQPFQTKKYVTDWTLINGLPPFPLDTTPTELPVAPYLQGKPVGPAANEMGWKDTIQVHPGEVTVIRARFSPIDGSPDYPFDATDGPGYVWHCHILDHEDNEMMRPYQVQP